MAYAVGQLIKKSEISYLDEAIIIDDNESVLNGYQNSIVLPNKETITFTDCIINPISKLTSFNTYYLSFYVDRMIIKDNNNDDVSIGFSFDIHLKQENYSGGETKAFYQYVRTIDIEEGLKGDKAFVNIIFTPNDNYESITLTVLRTQDDFNPNKTKKMTISNVNLQKINNILPQENIEKIGIQAPPGLLFTINGEEMMIGRTGIYELYNKNIPITYLGFVINAEDHENFFIVDYQYESSVKEGNT